jgi:arylamine N-acetyltransferase
MLDFAGYLKRIGLGGTERPTLHAIHRAHATSIPFENLDPHRGIPVSLAEEDLERKLVHERRGGYCFEHNLLLASAIEHIGLEVEPMLARVREGAPPGTLTNSLGGASGSLRTPQSSFFRLSPTVDGRTFTPSLRSRFRLSTSRPATGGRAPIRSRRSCSG